jgi:hypothetical protein
MRTPARTCAAPCPSLAPADALHDQRVLRAGPQLYRVAGCRCATWCGRPLADLRHAAEITAAEFGQCSWYQRVAERGASFFTRLS